MPFNLIYYSQQDPQWKADTLGFGGPSDTIGYIGCALTSVSMLLSGHGINETPRSLNQKLKNINGFAGAGIRWGAVNQLHSQVKLKEIISCETSDAPLSKIDAAIAAGQPSIVQVDGSPAPGVLTHWIVLYAKKGKDYLMLDPWPYQPDVTREALLMPRYSQGNPLQRSIMKIILYESSTADGRIMLPSKTSPQPAPRGSSGPRLRRDLRQPGLPSAPSAWPNAAAARKAGQLVVMVKGGVGKKGLSVFETPGGRKAISVEKQGAKLIVVEEMAKAKPKLGKAGKWLNVQSTDGRRGYVDAGSVKKWEQ